MVLTRQLGHPGLTGVAVAAVAVMAFGTSCTDPNQARSDTQADLRTEAAKLVPVTSCSSADIDSGGRMFPTIAEGSVPEGVVVKELLWCSFNDYARQMVERRTDAIDDVLQGVTDLTMTRAEADAECSLAVFTEPALFAMADQGGYRVSLARKPGCGSPTLAVRNALDANDTRWRIAETQQR